jgi:hypothetical protein
MAKRPRTHRLKDRDLADLIGGFDQIEQLVWAARKVLMDAAPSARIPGGVPCGRNALVEADATTCLTLYERAGGPPCKLFDGGKTAKLSRRPARK